MKRITIFIVIVLCITTCNNEVINNYTDNQVIELRMPDATKVTVYSEAANSENMIDEIWVLEFNTSGGLKHSELIEGSRIINKDNATQLLPQLTFKAENGNRIVCIANSGVTTPLPSDITYTTINTVFLLNDAYYSGGDYLPMYGEMEWSSSSSHICKMTRAVAKIQVQMGTSNPDVSGGFTAENVSYKIYDAGAGGYIQPSASVQGISQSTAGQATQTYYLSQKEGTAETEAYIHEYPTSTKTSTNGTVGDGTFNKDRQHIILTKTVGGINTYYRLDFYDAITKKYMDTERNHHYIFTIHKVRSEGYTRLEDAHHYPGSNIEYDFEIVDDSKSVASNGQYAIITSVDTAYITSAGAVTDSIIATARYKLPAGISLNPSTTNSIEVTSAAPSPSGIMTSTGISVLSATNENIKVTVNAAFTEGVITLKLGNITHRLHVKRKP
ncbi:MAG: hypothetical protein LBS79_03070 [Tannerella sp.]|nr:hypothetical protein [Tannerella sp.]